MNQQPDDINQINPASPDFQTELADKIADLAPEAVADGKIDFEKLKELLADDVDHSPERFGLFWPGKRQAIRMAQTPTTATLKPDKENSKDWDTTQNVFIEGDNLEVLKVLQNHYYGKIKMIYIDPPYNTGKDFVYKDNYTDGVKNYLEWSEQVNEEGQKISSNAESEGRYHSNWLNMMYPRLKLARNLLSDAGIFFVSISDEEQANLRRVLDEVFGEQNFLGHVIWNSTKSVTNTALISVSHTHNFIYARNLQHFVKNRAEFRLPDTGEGFTNPDQDPRGPWKADPFQVGGWRPNQQYEIINPNTGKIYLPNSGSSWKNDKETFDKLVEDNRIVFGVDGTSGPQRKRFLYEALERGRVAKTIWDDIQTTTNGTQQLKKIFGGVSLFDNPKPVGLIRRMLELATNQDSLILDFFSGSATTAHAVMQLNAEDGGNRKHIQVQLPEPTAENSEARKAGFSTIADISRERIRRAGEKIKEDFAEELAKRETPLDVGFRSYKLVDTNFAKWNLDSSISEEELQQELLSREGTAYNDAPIDDLLSELLLKQGLSLTEQVDDVEIAGLKLKAVGSAESDETGAVMLAYLDEHTPPKLEQLREVTATRPARFVILEDCFQGDDELKTNLVQMCKTNNIELWTA